MGYVVLVILIIIISIGIVAKSTPYQESNRDNWRKWLVPLYLIATNLVIYFVIGLEKPSSNNLVDIIDYIGYILFTISFIANCISILVTIIYAIYITKESKNDYEEDDNGKES